MRVTVVTPPAAEPLTTAEAKLLLRIDSSDLDGHVDDLIASARSFFEEATGFALIHRTLQANLRWFPKASNILLPYPPLASVTSVKYYPLGVETALVANTDYLTDNDARQGSILLLPGQSWPDDVLYPPGVVIEYVAGFGAAATAVPEDVLQCLRAIIAFWDDVPEAVYVPGDTKASGKVEALPLSASDVIRRYQEKRER